MKILYFLLFATFISKSWSKAIPELEQDNVLVKGNENSGRQINSILDIPQQVASFLGNALFPTTPTTTRATSTSTTVKPNRRAISSATTPGATVPPTPRIKYVYVTPPGPRVVIVKPRPFAPAVAVVPQQVTPQATEAPVVTDTEAVTEAVEEGDEDEDSEDGTR